MIDPTTARAEQLRESTGMAWEYACRQAERERDEAAPALGPELTRAARSAACRFFDGKISSADAAREFARIANSGWHGEPLNALHAEFDAAVSRLIDAAAQS